jgi:hypothetical protein
MPGLEKKFFSLIGRPKHEENTYLAALAAHWL